jgi:pyruvate dehydrogenase E2 component (dihydrolipoamide acetyltransferase)
VIRPPEVGIAGFGRITEKVVAVDGEVVVRPVLPIVVATDHRINDGAHLARFVSAVADAVAQPLLLLS